MAALKRTLTFFVLSASLLLSHHEEDGGMIVGDRMSMEGSAVYNLMIAIHTYSKENRNVPLQSFEQLNSIDPSIVEHFSKILGEPLSSRYLLINDHLHVEQLPDWKLIMINRDSVAIRNGKAYGRYLIYIDETNKIRRIGETEAWFEKWIGDAIPGISFGDVSSVEEPLAEIPATAPKLEEVAEVVEEVTATEPAIEEPAEVVIAEPVEEDVDSSSNWLLWLIGAVVVVGGVFVVRSRK